MKISNAPAVQTKPLVETSKSAQEESVQFTAVMRCEASTVERWIELGDWDRLDKYAARDALFEGMRAQGRLNARLLRLWRKLGGRDQALFPIAAEAARKGDVASVSCCIQEAKTGLSGETNRTKWGSFDVKQTTIEHASLLYVAAAHGRPDVVETLISQGWVDHAAQFEQPLYTRTDRPWWRGGGTVLQYNAIRGSSNGLKAALHAFGLTDRQEDYLRVIRLLAPITILQDQYDALNLAIKEGHTPVVAILRDHAKLSEQQREQLIEAAQRKGPRALLKALLRRSGEASSTSAS